MKQKKICKICKKEINTKTENWCVIIDYAKEQEIERGYYHIQCYRDRWKIREEMLANKFKRGVAGMIKNVLTRRGIDPQEIMATPE